MCKAPTGQLYAFTPSRSGRHDDKTPCSTPPQARLIPAGVPRSSLAPAEPSLPQYWNRYVQPEGKRYFVYSEPGSLVIVTECNLYDVDIREVVLFWIRHASERISGLRDDKNQCFDDFSRLELCLELDGEDCFYYIADHTNQTLFWFDKYNSEDLGLELVVSDSHLALTLQEQFWRHVEFFPMHLGGLSLACIDELICVVNHCIADKITSNVSTVLYTEDQCRKLIKVLKVARDYPTSGYQTCAVARIWAQIASQRVLTHYGQENVRLSLDQRILHAAHQPGRLSRTLGYVSLQESTAIASQLDVLFTDRVVYTEHWRKFLSQMLQVWREKLFLALAGLALHILFFPARPASGVLGTVSFSLFMGSAVASGGLVHRYRTMEDSTCQEIWHHLSSMQSASQGFQQAGFQQAGFLFALPTTLLFWGLIAFILNGLLMLTSQFGPELVAALGASCMVVILAATGLSRSFRFWRRPQKAEEQMV